MTTTHVCPRRGETPSVFNYPTEDTWEDRGGRGHLACSYCGSLNPDELMERLERGDVTLTPTDKSYKVYVEGEGLQHAKFYFQHLSAEQRRRFIELHNEKKMRLGYPGYFYTRPFFCAPADPVEA